MVGKCGGLDCAEYLPGQVCCCRFPARSAGRSRHGETPASATSRPHYLHYTATAGSVAFAHPQLTVEHDSVVTPGWRMERSNKLLNSFEQVGKQINQKLPRKCCFIQIKRKIQLERRDRTRCRFESRPIRYFLSVTFTLYCICTYSLSSSAAFIILRTGQYPMETGRIRVEKLDNIKHKNLSRTKIVSWCFLVLKGTISLEIVGLTTVDNVGYYVRKERHPDRPSALILWNSFWL